ncbi:MAG: LPS export ABC transporter periplasmic protein LptC [bacterium]
MICSIKKCLIYFICLIFGLIACDDKETTPVKSTEMEKIPSQEGYDSKLFISKAGVKQAVLHYGHMQKYSDEKVIYFNNGIELDFYNKDGKHTSYISADQGEFNEITEDVLGRGNVVVVSDTGLTLFTEELRWDSELNKILSDTLVMITSQEGDTLYGKGFESDPDLTRRVIYQPWGVSSEKVEIEKIKEEFIRTTEDTVTDQDSLNVRNSKDD